MRYSDRIIIIIIFILEKFIFIFKKTFLGTTLIVTITNCSAL